MLPFGRYVRSLLALRSRGSGRLDLDCVVYSTDTDPTSPALPLTPGIPDSPTPWLNRTVYQAGLPAAGKAGGGQCLVGGERR
ncbi:hypothetical protein COCCU_09275 [Corynebacterium occultum]|uniref:Uncharacterized protein n=1 Tax=Corynebacterium occultum TaxID=2675219 RepID=A0A6B8VXH7_9CORY|nr:hypothetical protein COCCU_09275 [Corynebacterium occultum]